MHKFGGMIFNHKERDCICRNYEFQNNCLNLTFAKIIDCTSEIIINKLYPYNKSRYSEVG